MDAVTVAVVVSSQCPMQIYMHAWKPTQKNNKAKIIPTAGINNVSSPLASSCMPVWLVSLMESSSTSCTATDMRTRLRVIMQRQLIVVLIITHIR